jgi:membrane-associated phospholipid phosphatase
MDSEIARARWMYLLGLAYLLIGYLGTNEFATLNPLGRPALPIVTEFDHVLPFTPWTVVFYVLYFPLLLTPLFLCSDVRALSRLTLAQAAINTVAYVIFILFPTPIDRPVAVPVDGVFHFVLDLLFRADHPYNTFPSLHVAQTCILALFFLHYSPRTDVRAASGTIGHASADSPHRYLRSLHLYQYFRSPIVDSSALIAFLHGAASVLVAASAVLIKQHYLADVFSGALLAFLASKIFLPVDR